MRIAIVSPAYPLRGGIAHHTALLYRKMCERDHQVKIVTFKRQYPEFFFPGKTQLDLTGEESFRVPTEPLIDSISPFTWFRAYRRLRAFSPELVIFSYSIPFFAPSFGTIAWLVKAYIGARILYLCHNVVPHEQHLGDILLTRYALGKGDCFIIQSAIVENQLLELYPGAKYKYIPHPVYEIFGEAIDKAEAKRKLGIEEEHVLLFFGYVRRYKGLDLLLRALPSILESHDLRLLVVGEFYEDEMQYRGMASELQIENKVSFHPEFQPSEKVPVFFSAADVVVLPYRSASQSGIVQLAYHLDTPCIVTAVGGLGEVVIDGKTGFVVQPDEPEAIAKAVVRFYSEQLEPEFRKNVQVEKLKYSWERMTEAIEELAS